MNVSKKSVAAMVSISIVIVSTAATMMLGVLISEIASRRWWTQLHSEETILADQLAESLALPLWNFDRVQMDKILQSAMQNRNIAGVAVSSAGPNERVYAKGRDENWGIIKADSASFPDGLLLQERDIRLADDRIGHVTVAATTQFTKAFLRYNRSLIVSILLLFNLVLAASLYCVLRRWVVRPLQEVEAFAVRVSSGGEEDLNVRTASFYGELESVWSSIQKMVAQLSARYRNLQKALELRRASEERLQTVFDSVNDAIFIHDAGNGAILDVNLRMCKMYGLTREEALKFDIGALSSGVRPYTQQDALDKLARAAAGDPQLFEWHAKHKDGHRFWVEVNMRRAAIAGIDRVIVVVRDVTARKEAEDALLQSERRYRTLFESAGDAIFLMQGDLFVDCNAETLRMFRCSREQIIGAPPYRFSPPVQPDGRDSMEKALEKIHGAMQGTPQRFEWKHTTFDGTPFDAEVSLNKIDLLSGAHLQAIVRDVSERKRAEDEIRQSEQKLRLILENAPYAVYVLSFEGKGLYCNRSAEVMSGYSRDELLRMHFLDLVHPEDRPELLKRREARIAGKAVETGYAIRIIDRAGSVHWAENRVIVLPWERKTATLNFLQDITERKRAEEELAKSEERFRVAFRTNPDAIIISRIEDGVLVDVNQGFTELTGYTREDVLGRRAGLEINIWNVPADRQRFIDDLKNKGVVDNLETQFRCKDGSVIFGSVTARVIMLDNVPHALSVGKDITERKRAEEALRESEELYRGFFSTSRDSVSITSEDGRILDCNDASLELLGYDSREELMQIQTGSLFVEPEAKLVALEQLKRDGYVQDYPLQMKRRDGTVIAVVVTSVLLRNPDGTIKARMSTIRDVTEKKRTAEEREKLLAEVRGALNAVSRSQREWQETFDSITDLISIHDKDFNTVKVNRAFMQFMGLPHGQILGEKCYKLLHRGAAECPHVRVLSDGKPAADEQFDASTGRTLHISTYPHQAPDGSIIGIIHIARDITDEKEREVHLIMTERLASLGQMASGIAHEINNPLESVMICTELLLIRVGKDRYDHSQFEKYLKIIDEEVLRCRAITSNMLSFSRQTAQEKTDVDAHLMIDKAIDLVGYQGRLKNVKVIKKYGKTFFVRGNEGELRQIFLVIVVNALDAMQDKGTLTVETGTKDESAWIRISDTGQGIPQEILDKIFQPFFTTKSEKGGTGLGLSIAHRIIASHHGSLTASSEAGKGAAFTIKLPL